MMLRSLIACCAFAAGLQGKLSPEQVEQLPPPASRPVHFGKDIRPILEASCINCHGRGKIKGGFAIDTKESFLKGGDTGPAALPGNSAESLIIEMVSGLNPDNVMPQKGKRLTPEEVGLLRKWIDQGLPWEEGVTFAKLPPKNLHPREPEVPAIPGIDHPVDRFILAQQSASAFEGPPVDDRLYARRVYLDVIGLLPTPAEMDRFVRSDSPNKRRELVRELLSREFDYAAHWLTFWNDALRNDYKGTGYIDGGRKQITSWLFNALAQNKPYDQFVSELVNPASESEGFAKGIIWRGVVNASQTPEMQAAQNISQVFMGVNLKCASCHDSFINDWRLDDAYNLASVYSEKPLEIFQCDAPTGKTSGVGFIYPELGGIDPSLPKNERLKQLSAIITSEKNGRLTRTMVNRLWARFMGRGLIEPLDEMENSPWNQDLLDWLAADLARADYNLKHTIETILTSRAYQLPAARATEREEKNFVFRGPSVRRMSAEQFIDTMAQVAGIRLGDSAARIDFSALVPADERSSNTAAEAKWIWSHAGAQSKAEAGTVYFRRLIDLPAEPSEAALVISCDNSFDLFINGKSVASGKDHTKPAVIDVRKHLTRGINLIAVAARNWAGAPNNPEGDQRNPAGFWAFGRVQVKNAATGKESSHDFGSDQSWLWNVNQPDGWQRPEFAAAHWSNAAELGEANAAPWKLGARLQQTADNIRFAQYVRAALMNNDSLMTALGRPNREQVVTSRASAASTLQALELTNGSTLASHLKQAAPELASGFEDDARLVSELYRRAFGREPAPSELQLCLELIRSSSRAEGVEDLLWSLAMLPEFQLIY